MVDVIRLSFVYTVGALKLLQDYREIKWLEKTGKAGYIAVRLAAAIGPC